MGRNEPADIEGPALVTLDGEHLVRLIGLIRRDAEVVLPKKKLALKHEAPPVSKEQQKVKSCGHKQHRRAITYH